MAVINLPPQTVDPPASVNNESPCLRCLSPSQTELAIVWAMAQLLKYDGGADYTNLADLTKAVKCYKCEPDSVLKTFELNSWLDEAAVAGLPAMTQAQFNDAIKCWTCLDPKTVKAAYTFLIHLLIKRIVLVL